MGGGLGRGWKRRGKREGEKNRTAASRKALWLAALRLQNKKCSGRRAKEVRRRPRTGWEEAAGARCLLAIWVSVA